MRKPARRDLQQERKEARASYTAFTAELTKQNGLAFARKQRNWVVISIPAIWRELYGDKEMP